MTTNIPLLKSIIFDLDGTLINSIPDVRLALNHTLTIYGQPEIEHDEIVKLIGDGIHPLITKAFAKTNVVLKTAEINKAISHYLDYYKSNPVVATNIYPDVVNTLQQFKENGLELGICTNKPSIMTKIILEKLNLKHFFTAIISGDEMSHAKPHPDHIQEILRQMNVINLPSVMVGDSIIDKLSAENANIPFIGVSYGYGGNQLNSDMMINHFSELPAALYYLSTRGNIES